MPSFKKSPFYAYCLLLTACLLILSCQPNKPPEKKSYGDTIVAASFHGFSSINPVTSVSSVSSELESVIFDGLIKIAGNGEPKPNLASSWNISKDGLRWTFSLRKVVRFHDGVELTAEDAVWTYNAIKSIENKGRYFNFFESVKDIKAIDKYTVEIILEKPHASFLYGLEVGILPKHLLIGKDLRHTEFNYHPIGTGLYKFVTSPHGGEGQGEGGFSNEIILKANEDYFNGRPYLDKIIVKTFANQKIMWARLMRGEIDFSSGINPSDYEIIENIPSFKTYSVLKPYYYMIAFNLNPSPHNPLTPFDKWDLIEGIRDKKIRQALNYAIDKEKLVREALKGMGRVSAGTVYPLSYSYYKDIKPYPYNPRKALQLLKEAGFGDKEIKLSVLINKGDEVKERSMRLIQEQLLDIGIKLHIELVDLPSMSKRCLQRDFESVFIEIASINDPDINYMFWHSSQIEDGLNMFSYKNQRVDELLDKGRAVFDREKRMEYYNDFQKEILDDPPGIFLFWTEYLVGVHERFENVKVDWRGTFANIAEWHVPEEKQKYKQ